MGGVEVGLACIPLLTQRLSDFGLIITIHSISTLPMSHCKYNEWSCKVEIWLHHVQASPHHCFWFAGGDNFGSRPLHFTPRWSIFRLIQEFHSSLTLPTSHYKYNEWLEKGEIGIWALIWSPQSVLGHGWGWSWLGLYSTFDTEIEWLWTDYNNSQHLNPSNVSM